MKCKMIIMVFGGLFLLATLGTMALIGRNNVNMVMGRHSLTNVTDGVRTVQGGVVVARTHELSQGDVANQGQESLRDWFVALLNAYTNIQHDVFCVQTRDLPGAVTNMDEREFLDVIKPFGRGIRYGFWEMDDRKDFRELEEFVRFVEINLQAVNFYGEVLHKRHSFPGTLMLLDRLTLRQLIRLRDRFKIENRREFESYADQCVRDWMARMDDEDGFVRTRCFFEVDLQWPLVEEGHCTRSELFEMVSEMCLAGFDTLGYRPKWLGELKRYCDTKEIDHAQQKRSR